MKYTEMSESCERTLGHLLWRNTLEKSGDQQHFTNYSEVLHSAIPLSALPDNYRSAGLQCCYIAQISESRPSLGSHMGVKLDYYLFSVQLEVGS